MVGPPPSSSSSSNNKNNNNSNTTDSRLAAPGFRSPATDAVALVTGSSGLCGARVVELLLERGTQIVVALDIVPPDAALLARFAAVQAQTGGTIRVRCGKEEGDLTSDAAVAAAFAGDGTYDKIDICYHIAALVGPFYDRQVYWDVNVHGTQRILDACQKYNVRKLVYSSSPGTRFTGPDICGLREEDLPIPRRFLAIYAETKAIGEVAVRNACRDIDDNPFYTVAVAPHQIYGPHDRLFLQKFLEVAGHGRLRIFGKGGWKISLCHVDNYAHGLLCGADALVAHSPALGQFYIVTDGPPPQDLWVRINEAGMAMGFVDLRTKLHLPVWFMYIVATLANVAGFLLHRKFKLNYFSLRMITMHRYFDITNAQRDLQYQPIKTFEQAWPETLEWFRLHWLPGFLAEQKGQQRGPKKTN